MVVNKFLLMKFKVLLLQSLPISQPDIILLYSELRVFAVFFSHEIVASHHLLSPPTAPNTHANAAGAESWQGAPKGLRERNNGEKAQKILNLFY